MTLEEVLSSVQFWEPGVDWGNVLVGGLGVSAHSPAEREVIRNAIAALYADEVNARPLLESLATSGILRFAKARAGESPARAVVPGALSYVVIDMSRISLAKIVNLNGDVVFEDPIITIAHELKHLAGASDPSFPDEEGIEFENFHNSGVDLQGEAVRFANVVAGSIGRSTKKSANYSVRYLRYLHEFKYDNLVVGTRYTNGAEIDNAIIGRTVSFTDGVPNTITTVNRGDSRDLLLGLDGNDTLNSGSGNDHIWGGEGNDNLNAGDGDDFVHGEDGEDAITGGQGSDRINGGHSEGIFSSFYDGQIDTLNYSGFGVGVRFSLGSANSDESRPGRVSVKKNNGSFGTDSVDEVEKFVGTSFADSLDLEEGTVFTAFSDDKVIFDLGSHNASGIVGDTIHAGNFGRSLTFDLRVSSAQFVTDIQSGERISIRGADAVVGTNFGDTLFANNRGNALVGSGGSDFIFGGTGNDRLAGGYTDGNRNYSDDNARDQLSGGGGADIFYAGDGDIINDSDSDDVIYVTTSNGHVRLFGATETAVGSGTYRSTNGVTYTRSGNAITVKINPEITIQNFRNGDAGIRLLNREPETGVARQSRDPLIIDLDGNRSIVKSLASSFAYFDLDNDGFRERVAWAQANDGFLVRDLNSDGSIDDASEMFGSGRMERDAGSLITTGTDGFAELATLDSNLDGKISTADAAFGSLRVWRDANGDAQTDEGELLSLADIGITEISLTTTPSDDLDVNTDGSRVDFMSIATFADGSVRSVYDAYLATDQYDSREIVTDVSVPADFADLPFLIGSGDLSDLDVAMARDVSLEAMVREFAALSVGQAFEISERVEAILIRWTGADSVLADSRGANINARWLKAIEKITGREFVQARIGANPRGDASATLMNEWQTIVGRTTASLLGQTALGQVLMPGLSFEAAAFFTAAEGATLASVLASLESHAPTTGHDALQYWQAAVRSLVRYDQQLGFTRTQLATALDPLLQAGGVPLTGAQLLETRYVGDASAMAYAAQATTTQFHVVGDGVERLVGSGAKDVYLIGAGVGNVRLATQVNSLDEIWLLDTLRGDLQSTISVTTGNSAVDAEFELTLTSTSGDLIRLSAALTTSGFNAAARVVQFAGGERLNLSDLLANSTFTFGASGQVQFGKTDSSIDLSGTLSADLLVGYGQTDRYLVGPGRGSDFVRDVSSSSQDRVVVSTTLSDVRFTASGIAGRDLTMTFLSTGEKVTIVGQLGAIDSQVDFIEFSGGLTLSASEIRTVVTTGATGNDRLIGTNFGDVIDGKGGVDLVSGGRGDDEYRFNLGYGQLSIDDIGYGNSIRFGAGILPADLGITGDGTDLVISIAGTADSVRLVNARFGESIGLLHFANAPSVGLATFLSQAAAQAGTSTNGTIIGTEAADDIAGTSGNDRILGLGGQYNYLSGLGGNDTYVFGGGQDVISESLSGYDTLEIPAGFRLEDMRMIRTGSSGSLKIWFERSDGHVTLRNGFTTAGIPDTSVADDVERIVFADGRSVDLTLGERTTGTAGNDYLYSFRPSNAIITPGAGNDFVNFTLLSSNNVVRYTSNDIGNDVIRLPEISEGAGSLTNSFSLQLQATLYDATVKLARTGVDLVVSFTNRSDSITITDYFNPLQRELFFHGNTMGGVSFSNASFTFATLSAAIAQRTAGDDVLFGRTNLDGGAGNDILIGADLTNNYSFGRGYGHDLIKEQDSISGSFSSTDTPATTGDTLTMVGLNRSDVEFFRSPIDSLSIVIRIKDSGETLTLDGSPFDDLSALQRFQLLTPANDVQDQNGAHWIERIIFQDGEMSQLSIEQAIVDAERTAGNDVITNFGTYSASGSSITALQSPTYDGGVGDDTYVNAFDRMSLRMSSTTGHDLVRNSGEGLTTIKLSLSDLNLADIYTRAEIRGGVPYLTIYSRNGSSLAIEVPRGFSGTTSDSGLRVFVTDQTGAIANLRPNAVGNHSTAATGALGTINPDILWGSFNADTFVSGAGDDIIFGQGGNDVVEFRLGDGADTLIGNRPTTTVPPPPALPTTSGGYRIAFKGNIAPGDISYQWLNDNSGNVKIVVGNQGDSLTVRYDSVVNFSFESTGTTITPIWASTIPIATSGNDNLFMLPGSTINGLAGDDTVTSIGSNGTVRFGPGSGHDVFASQINGWLASPSYSTTNFNSQAGASFAHTVQFDGINSLSELVFEKSGENLSDLTVRIIATGETLTIRGQLSEAANAVGTAGNGNLIYQTVVNSFRLSDGTTIGWQRIHSLISGVAQPIDATIATSSDGGTLDGGAGFDTLLGGSGADTYVFGRGYDEDAIRDAGGEDLMTFGEEITRDELYFSRIGSDGQDLLVEVTGIDRLSATITGQFSENAQGRIEYFELSDGTLMGYREVERFILDTNSTSAGDTILGFVGDDRIDAQGGNDSIKGLAGNDVIDGGSGRDQAVFRGKASEYEVSTLNGVTTVSDLVSGRDGTDTLRGVEDLVFLGDGGLVQSIIAPNRAPTALPLDLTGTEDSDLVIARSTLLGLASDADGDNLTLSVGDGVNGRAWIGTDGNIRFRPDNNYNGDATFRYVISDGNGGTTSAIVTMTLSAVNDAPRVSIALEDFSAFEDRPVSILVPILAFTDPDGQNLSLNARLANGDPLPTWLSFADNILSGTPPQNFNGSLEISITATDGSSSVSDTFRLAIIPANDAPTVLTELADAAVRPGSTLVIAIPTANYGDAEGDALNITVRQANGEALPNWLTYSGGVLQGTAPVELSQTLSLVVVIDDSRSVTTDYFDILVAENSPPTLEHPLADASSPEDTPINVTIPADAFNDIDGDVLSFQARLANGDPLPAWLALDGRVFTGFPPANFNGAYDIEVTASDGNSLTSDIFRLTVLPVNDAPLLVLSLADRTVQANVNLDFAIPTDSFVDLDGDALTYLARMADGASLPAWLQFDGTRFTGTPPAGVSAAYDIVVTASDAATSATDTFRLTVFGGNNALPTAVNDGLFVSLQAQSLLILSSDLLANDSDPDGNSLSIVSVQGAAHGTVVFNSDGNIVYSAAGDYVGPDSFIYTLSDGAGTTTATVSLRVDGLYTTWSQGGSGDDRLFGNMQITNRLFGGAGDDHMRGGQEADWLAGGDGADKLNGLAGDDHLWGNAGNDQLSGAAGFDRAYFFGLRSSYSVATINGTVTVIDNAAGVDGNDGTDTIASIEQLVFKNGETASVVSPIILDLDGNGVQTVAADISNARYDLDDDGLADDTSWIGSTEGFLFLDRDGNGTVTNSGEFSFIDDVPGATSDLAGLRAFDSNRDGRLSATDARFANFRVWRDSDGDGAVDTGEVLTLAQAGVASINLTGTAVNASSAFGEVAVLNNGSYTRTNGTTMQFIDAALTYFSAASNEPELSEQDYNLDLKAKKYAISIAGGAISLGLKKPKGSVDVAAGRIGANATLTFKDKTIGMLGAIVLDLDGNGVDLKRSNKNSAAFDMNGDGRADDTGWISKRDGFLVIDRDGDGQITDASELSMAAESEDAANALEGLAVLDSNGDRIIDARDARFGELRVWIDANQNGISDAGELKTLAEAGIASFRLSATAARDYTIKMGDNAVLSTATFTRVNGSVGTLGNVSLGFVPGNGPVRAGGSATPELDPTVTNAPWLGLTDAPFGTVELPMNVEPQIGETAPLKQLVPISDVLDPAVAAAIANDTATPTASVRPKQLVPIADAIDPAVAAAIAAGDGEQTAPAAQPKVIVPIADVIDPAIAAEIGGTAQPQVPAVQPKVLTPIADAIDPAIAAAIAALQTGSSSNPLSVFDIPGDPETFDRVSRSELPWQAELTNLPLTVSIDDKWPVEDIGQVTTMDRPVLLEAVAVLDGAPAPLDSSVLDSAKRLALLRQDIAAFGGRAGAEQLDWNGNSERALVSMF